MGKNKKTLVTLLLDRSGSMQSVKDDTIGAINSYIEELKSSKSKIHFSLILFDSFGGGCDLEKVYVAEKIKHVKPLKSKDFNPRGGTPLIDASYKTIRAVEESLKGKDANVVFAIQTDGNENQSVENSWKDLKSLISEKEESGWEFVFMGCGIDAYNQGERMGISKSKTVSYGKDKMATMAAFRATAQNTAMYSSGVMADLSYSDKQKADSGDMWKE